MKDFSELKNVELDDMVLFHEDDSHFNLVVSKNGDLATLGSLSYRFNVGPMVNSTDDKDVEAECDIDEEIEHSTELIDAKNELKKCLQSKNIIENEYFNCEKELRNKTEEVEKLKVELKDLKEILRLKDECKETACD